jgi:hypothetical protein
MPTGVYERKKLEYFIDNNGCKNCTSYKLNGKYPAKSYWKDGVKKKTTLHRWLWMQKFGNIPEGLVVRHLCNNTKCINLEHLELGTPYENNEDKELDGTMSFGESHYAAKLSNKDVLGIFLAKHRTSRIELMKKYGVSRYVIDDIRAGNSWTRLTFGLKRPAAHKNNPFKVQKHFYKPVGKHSGRENFPSRNAQIAFGLSNNVV